MQWRCINCRNQSPAILIEPHRSPLGHATEALISSALGWVTVLLCAVVLAGCASGPSDVGGAPDHSASSYTVDGQTYHVLASAAGFRQTGRASWYGRKFHGRATASGEIYDMHQLTAAHKTLPLGSRVRVTNRANGKHVNLRVNDRGPFHDGRIIDLSYAAAEQLGMALDGTARVRVAILESSSDRSTSSRQKSSASAGNMLQTGAFASRDRAVQQRDKLRRLGIDSVHIERGDGRRRLYRVRIGPLHGTNTRQRVRQKLRSGGMASVSVGD